MVAALKRSALVSALAVISSASAWAPAPTSLAAAEPDPTSVGHRVVWAYQKGGKPIRVFSAEPDGSDRRKLFATQRHVSARTPALDHEGRQVAVAFVKSGDADAVIRIADVMGGDVRTLRIPNFQAISGIGWSPNGNRLALEVTYRNNAPHHAIWTVRTDGTDLQRTVIVRCSEPQNTALAWTDQGIAYLDCENNLRLVNDGEDSILMRHVASARLSGDGNTLITRRTGAKRGIWISQPDGSHPRRLFKLARESGFQYVVPNYDGSMLLAIRHSVQSDSSPGGVAVWPTAGSPDSATVLDLGSRYLRGVSWN